ISSSRTSGRYGTSPSTCWRASAGSSVAGCLRCAFRGELDPLVDGRCVVCGREFERLPLFVLNGATGIGKTTIGTIAAELMPECIHLDGDLLWSNEFFGDDVAVDA